MSASDAILLTNCVTTTSEVGNPDDNRPKDPTL